MFPDPTKGDPSGQVSDMLSALGGASYSRIWLDIEGPMYWSSSQSTNQAFFNGLVSALGAADLPEGASVGVYTSESQVG